MNSSEQRAAEPPAPSNRRSPVGLSTVNSMDVEQFVGLLGGVVEHTPSVAEHAWSRRPFVDVDSLHRAMCDVLRGFDRDQQVAVLRAHPELGARRTMADLSVQEQHGAGLDRMAAGTGERMAALNLEYRDRFGFPFIIAVRGREPLEVLAAMHQRMQRPAEAELTTALDEVMTIAGLRLAALVVADLVVADPVVAEPVVDEPARQTASDEPSRSGPAPAVPPAPTPDPPTADPPTVEPPTAQPPTAEPPTAEAPSAAASVDNTSAGLEHAWHPVATSAEVGDSPVRVMLLGRPWVLFRIDGILSALADRCVHRGAPLSRGCLVQGTIECPYHGWRFDVDGSCVHIPALSGGRAPSRAHVAAPAGLLERYGLIWMAPEAPAMDLIEVPEAEDDSFGAVISRPVRTTASAAQVVDNFLDVTHFSYLHRSTFGLSAPVTVEDYVVERGPWQVSLHHRTMFSAGDEPARPRVGHYHCTIPFSVRLVGEFPGTHRRDVICLFAQPETADCTRIYKLLAYNQLGPGSPADRTLDSMDEFEAAVLSEDIRMLELLPETQVPLSPTTEFHTKADRATVEWRRLLRTLLDGSAT